MSGTDALRGGPLAGVRIIELAGIGPGPMAGMLLADMGAEVVLVERDVVRNSLSDGDISFRGKRSVVLDLKKTDGREAFLRLVETADAVIEGFRPGVCERLGIGPDECLHRNPRTIFGRITGWGQSGPLAKSAGHDINYIALTGALFSTGRAGAPPSIPLNLVGDMGGGGMLLAFGVVCGILNARVSGRGQVVDAAMVDGASLLMWMIHSWHAQGRWDVHRRGVNLLDGGSPYYDTYETRDGGYVSIGPLEPQFYSDLLARLGIDDERFTDQQNRAHWPVLRERLTHVFLSRTRAEWQQLLEGTDTCFAPVLALDEVPRHPHNREREAYLDIGGVIQPAPAPRFSATPPRVRHGPPDAGADTTSILLGLGYGMDELAAMRESGAIRESANA